MNMKGIGSVAVLVLVASIVFYKQASTPEPATPSVVDHGTARVVLIADPREAGQSCGCGRIISLVRAVGAGALPCSRWTLDPEAISCGSIGSSWSPRLSCSMTAAKKLLGSRARIRRRSPRSGWPSMSFGELSR